jgi:hypothetical protein
MPAISQLCRRPVSDNPLARNNCRSLLVLLCSPTEPVHTVLQDTFTLRQVSAAGAHWRLSPLPSPGATRLATLASSQATSLLFHIEASSDVSNTPKEATAEDEQFSSTVRLDSGKSGGAIDISSGPLLRFHARERWMQSETGEGGGMRPRVSRPEIVRLSFSGLYECSNSLMSLRLESCCLGHWFAFLVFVMVTALFHRKITSIKCNSHLLPYATFGSTSENTPQKNTVSEHDLSLRNQLPRLVLSSFKEPSVRQLFPKTVSAANHPRYKMDSLFRA